MPIRLASHPDMPTPLGKGTVSPVFLCDACGKPIDDARQALYLMQRDAQGRPYSEIVYTHKGPCFESLTSHEGFAYADDLTDFAITLLNRAHLSHILSPEYRF
jgi:hypothetical protein